MILPSGPGSSTQFSLAWREHTSRLRALAHCPKRRRCCRVVVSMLLVASKLIFPRQTVLGIQADLATTDICNTIKFLLTFDCLIIVCQLSADCLLIVCQLSVIFMLIGGYLSVNCCYLAVKCFFPGNWLLIAKKRFM